VAEPYAWQAVGGTIWNHKTSEDDTPLYIKPQWQGLTDDELREMLGYGKSGYIAEYTRNFVNAIEAKLKEKNR
jgi:hypothetical protein